MTRRKKKSWKEVIDPGFDHVIKAYASFLRDFQESVKEGFHLDEEWTQTALQSTEHLIYLKDRPTESVIQYLKEMGILTNDQVDLLNYSGTSKQDFFEKCLRMVEKLPRESQDFYRREIESLLSDSSVGPTFTLFEVPKKSNLNRYSLIGSLLMRYFFLRIEDILNHDSPDSDVLPFDKPELALYAAECFYSIYADLSFQRTLRNRLRLFRDSDNEKALLNALAVDKRLLFLKKVQDKVYMAQLAGDYTFFRKLGKAIAFRPLDNRQNPSILYPILIVFWQFGLHRLTRSQLLDFLVECEVISSRYPLDSLEKIVQRYILPSFRE